MIPCEFFDAENEECRVRAFLSHSNGIPALHQDCPNAPDRNMAEACRLRSLALGEAVKPASVPEQDEPDPRQLTIDTTEALLAWKVCRCSCGLYSLHKCGRWAHRWFRDGAWHPVFVPDKAKPCRCGQSLERVETEAVPA